MKKYLFSAITIIFLLNIFLFNFVESASAYVYIYGRVTSNDIPKGINDIEFKFNQSIKLDYCPADFKVKSRSSENKVSADPHQKGKLTGSTCWGLLSYTDAKDIGFVETSQCFASLGKAADVTMEQTHGWWNSTIVNTDNLAAFDRSISGVDPSEGRCSVTNCGRHPTEYNTVIISIKNSPPPGKTRGRYFIRNFRAVQSSGGPESLTARLLRDSTDVLTSSSTGYTDLIEVKIPWNVNGPYELALAEWVDETSTPPPATPTPSPAVTPSPSPSPGLCAGACDTTKPDSCPSAGAEGNCVCVPTEGTKGICRPQPSPSPTPSPTPSPSPRFVCDQPCDVTRPNDCAGGEKDGCDICRTKPAGGTTCQPFSKNFCQCEKLLSVQNPIVPGQRTTFEAFYKVEGPDVKHAQLKSVRFRMAEMRAGGATGTVILQSEPITPEIIENTASVVRYKATWTTTIPLNIKTGVEYKVFVPVASSSQFGEDFKCERKRVTALSLSQRVLGAKADWCRFIPFSQYFFSACKDDPASPTEPDPTPNPDSESNLQLKTFAPAKTSNATCNSIDVKFDTF